MHCRCGDLQCALCKLQCCGHCVGQSQLENSAPPFTAQLDSDDSECYKRGTETASSARKRVWMLRLQDARPIFQSFVAKTIGKHL
jgi:hypothetical protein